MKSIVRKTKDNSGATIIMALLFMLVCVMISTALIAASGSAARDVNNQREQQKAYLAVSSAIDIMRHDIENTKVYKKFNPEDPNSLLPIDEEEEAAFIPLLQTALENAQSEENMKMEGALLTCDGPGADDLKVQFDFSMDKESYKIVIKCRADKTDKEESSTAGENSVTGEGGQSDKKGKPLYSMTATFKKKYYKDDYYTWKLSSITKGEG